MTAMATRWEFEALDTLFFRDAIPFNAGEGGQGGQRSLFPPSMNTLQGVIRYQLALGQGWLPGHDGDWPGELGASDDLGMLSLRGAYICRHDQVLFPAPLLLLHKTEHDSDRQRLAVSYHRLAPGPEVKTDLGAVRLPQMPDGATGAKPMESYWLTAAAMASVLDGKVPETTMLTKGGVDPGNDAEKAVFGSDELWEYEPKVGIGRDSATRTASDSRLYAVNLVRPIKGVTVVVGVDDIPPAWFERYSPVVGLGGEGKLAALKISDKQITLPARPELDAVNRKVLFTVTLITPGYFGDKARDAIEGQFERVPGKCVSACLGRAMQIGGWDLMADRPRPLRPFLPPGSTWFYEGEEWDIPQIQALHGCLIGDEKCNKYGYGQILIGRWEERK